MKRTKLLLFPLLIGVILMVSSWFLSYPLSIDSSTDFVFNDVSPLYWFSLPLLLVPMFLVCSFSRSYFWKWVIIVAVVITIYSLSYFYYTVPGSDSHYFRGLTEYYLGKNSLDPSEPNHNYFQWPSFFILANTVTTVNGMDPRTYEFLLYAVIGFLLATALYVYASKVYKRAGFLSVMAFLMPMFYFLNYQCVPFSFAFGLLLILFMLETMKKSSSNVVASLVLFTTISFAHAFVALFYVLYLFVLFILKRGKGYGQLAMLTLTIYLTAWVTQARFSFVDILRNIFTTGSEYNTIVGGTLTSSIVPIDVTAQVISRIVTITAIAICFVGFVVLSIIKRKIRDCDKALFFTGGIYSAIGTVLSTLGSRAIPLVLIPVSQGASYLFESRYRLYVEASFIILLSLFAFIPLHGSFQDGQISFQTKEAREIADFMIEKYNWSMYGSVLSHVSIKWYIYPQVESHTVIETDESTNLSISGFYSYYCVIYSIGLAKSLQRNNISEDAFGRIMERDNVVYDSGSSYVALIVER